MRERTKLEQTQHGGSAPDPVALPPVPTKPGSTAAQLPAPGAAPAASQSASPPAASPASPPAAPSQPVPTTRFFTPIPLPTTALQGAASGATGPGSAASLSGGAAPGARSANPGATPSGGTAAVSPGQPPLMRPLAPNLSPQAPVRSGPPLNGPGAGASLSGQASPPQPARPEPRADSSVRIDVSSLDLLTSAATNLTQVARRRELANGRRLALARELAQLAREAEDLGPAGSAFAAKLNKAKDTAAALHREAKLLANEELRDLGQVVEEVQRIRMLPLSVLFEPYPRVVRDLARELGKEVDLVVDGEDTRADRAVVEALREPLLHLIRNALDHGLESPGGSRGLGQAAPRAVSRCAPRARATALSYGWRMTAWGWTRRCCARWRCAGASWTR